MQTSWNFGSLDTREEQLETVKQKNESFAAKWKERQDYLNDPKVLLEALLEFDDLQKNFGTTGDLGYYWGLKESLDQSDTNIKAQVNKLQDFTVKMINLNQFFLIKLSKISMDKQKEFLNSPILCDFKHCLQRTFATGKFTLSEAEEKILNIKQLSSYANWVRMTSQFVDEEKVNEKTLEQHLSDMLSVDPKVRAVAGESTNEILRRNVKIAEHELNSILYDYQSTNDLKGLTRPDQLRHITDDIDSEVVDSMIEAVSSKFSLAHKYYQLKAKLLDMPKLNYWDKNAPVGTTEIKYDFEKSVALVSEVFGKLDPEFQSIFMRFIDNGQVDVFPAPRKRGGAFCAIERPTQPTYILLNHTDKLRDVLTLAHEAGHGINNELMKSQKYAANFGSPLSTAEVASTFMEDFVLQSLPKDKSLLMTKLGDDVSTIFRQVAAYKFEQELHAIFRKKSYLSKEEIGEIFKKHMTSYMGDAILQNEGTENWWVYWTHFRSFFYVYSYASGLLISKSLQNKVKQDPKFIIQVKKFLSAGSSDSPKNIFKNMGIDISDQNFWLSGLSEIETNLSDVIRF